MSVEAMAWAKRQRTGSQGANSVLRAIADYADEDGCCWPSRRQIAFDTEMSTDTVSRHLAALEAAALIEREERLRDNGSRSTDMIRLRLARPAGEPTPSANCGVPPSAICGDPPPQIAEAPSAKTGRPELPIEPFKKEPPIAPQGGGVGTNENGFQEQADTQFDVFLVEYDPDPAFSRRAAERSWSRLTSAERAEALASVPRYRDHCAKAKRRRCDPSTYLRERRWTAFTAAPPKAEPAPRPVEDDPVRRAVLWAMSSSADRAGWVFVEQGSAAWEAWRGAFAAAGFANRFTIGRHLPVRNDAGMWVPSEQPGRNFPLRYPPKGAPEGHGEATGPPPGLSDAEREQFIGGG